MARLQCSGLRWSYSSHSKIAGSGLDAWLIFSTLVLSSWAPVVKKKNVIKCINRYPTDKIHRLEPALMRWKATYTPD